MTEPGALATVARPEEEMRAAGWGEETRHPGAYAAIICRILPAREAWRFTGRSTWDGRSRTRPPQGGASRPAPRGSRARRRGRARTPARPRAARASRDGPPASPARRRARRRRRGTRRWSWGAQIGQIVSGRFMQAVAPLALVFGRTLVRRSAYANRLLNLGRFRRRPTQERRARAR